MKREPRQFTKAEIVAYFCAHISREKGVTPDALEATHKGAWDGALSLARPIHGILTRDPFGAFRPGPGARLVMKKMKREGAEAGVIYRGSRVTVYDWNDENSPSRRSAVAPRPRPC